MARARCIGLWLCLLFGSCGPLQAQEPIVIGVLSHRGSEATLRHWSPTADYLTHALPGYEFRIRPLRFEEVEPAVADQRIDFILVNSGIYVSLEVRFGVARIATLNNRLNGVAYNNFGGVIFTRAGRSDLRTLEDLRGQRFMAVDETSLGGYQMAWREMHPLGIRPDEDFELSFAGTHDEVVAAVRSGRVDAGTVRTNILERMASAGDIRYEEFRIIHPLSGEDFPFVRSTRLYPEWPFAKLQHTPNRLAQSVAVALLSMPVDHPAAGAGRYAGWTVPLDYQAVHELFKELSLGPYSEPVHVTLLAVWREYWPWLLVVSLLLSLVLVAFYRNLRLNQRLKRAKAGLEREYSLILDSVGDGIMGVDLEGNATFINAATTRITGWTTSDLVGRNMHEILHHTRVDGSAHPSHECPVYATFRDDQPQWVDDDMFWRKDGTGFPVEYLSTPLRDSRGLIQGAVVVFRDASERLRAEEEARLHQAELAHVARLNTMGEMASGIAHELNQPLAAISNYTNGCIRMLRSGTWSPESFTDVLGVVADQAQRAGHIIRELRNFVRKEEPDKTLVDINEVVRSVSVLVKQEVRRAGVVMMLELAFQLPRVAGRSIQLEQVVLNLVRNAVDAMVDLPQEARRLIIRTQHGVEGVQVSVSDSGPGMSPEVIERVFDPFYTTKAQGMGLGLSISQGIIYAHGGHLIAHANPDVGVTFEFTLPTAQEENRDY